MSSQNSLSNESFDLDELQNQLEAQLEENLSDLEGLEEDFKKIGSPEALGDTIQNVIWEQFINQIGVVAGQDFIKENRGLTLDLRKSAHIQTTENFEKGKIATHNPFVDHQERYDKYRENFYTDPDNEYFIKANEGLKSKGQEERYRFNDDIKAWEQYERGSWKTKLNGNYRKDFDKDRPIGNKTKNTAVDHTKPTTEYVRDPRMNAFVDKEKQVELANSENNLNEIDARANSSKRDSNVEEWLNSTRDGKTPEERFDFDKEKMIKKDKKQREDDEKEMIAGEKKSIETGKKSRKEEAFRIGGTALKAVLMGLLAELVKEIIQKLIQWLYAGKKNLSSFFDSLKKAITNFISNLKDKLFTAGDTFLTSIVTAIFGPIIGTIKKVWIFLKQGYKSLKQAIAYIKNPENKNKPMSILMLEVGKIVIAGLTAGGAIVLGQVIEKGLMTIPGFAFPIPLLGSLASILGIFFGAISSGIIGAIAMNLIDKLIAEKQKRHNIGQQLEKKNEVLTIQNQQIVVSQGQLNQTKDNFGNNVVERHTMLREEMNNLKKVFEEKPQKPKIDNSSDLDDLFNKLNDL